MSHPMEGDLSPIYHHEDLPHPVWSEETFTKWVGAESFHGAVEILLRTKNHDEMVIEDQFNTIKGLSKERDGARAEVERLQPWHLNFLTFGGTAEIAREFVDSLTANKIAWERKCEELRDALQEALSSVMGCKQVTGKNWDAMVEVGSPMWKWRQLLGAPYVVETARDVLTTSAPAIAESVRSALRQHHEWHLSRKVEDVSENAFRTNNYTHSKLCADTKEALRLLGEEA